MSIYVESWRGQAYYVDRYEQNKTTLAHFITFLQDRWNSEEQYQKRLDRLVAKVSVLSEGGTLGNAWKALQSFTIREEQQRAHFQNFLYDKLLLPIIELRKDQQTAKQLYASEISKLDRTLGRKHEQMLKSKQKHENLCNDLNTSKSVLEKADSVNMKPREVSKLKTKIESLEKEVQLTDKLYAHHVEVFEEYKKLYKESMKKILTNFADMDAERIFNVKDILLDYVEQQESMYRDLVESSEQLKLSVLNINERVDVRLFLNDVENKRKSNYNPNILSSPSTTNTTLPSISMSATSSSNLPQATADKSDSILGEKYSGLSTSGTLNVSSLVANGATSPIPMPMHTNSPNGNRRLSGDKQPHSHITGTPLTQPLNSKLANFLTVGRKRKLSLFGKSEKEIVSSAAAVVTAAANSGSSTNQLSTSPSSPSYYVPPISFGHEKHEYTDVRSVFSTSTATRPSTARDKSTNATSSTNTTSNNVSGDKKILTSVSATILPNHQINTELIDDTTTTTETQPKKQLARKNRSNNSNNNNTSLNNGAHSANVRRKTSKLIPSLSIPKLPNAVLSITTPKLPNTSRKSKATVMQQLQQPQFDTKTTTFNTENVQGYSMVSGEASITEEYIDTARTDTSNTTTTTTTIVPGTTSIQTPNDGLRKSKKGGDQANDVTTPNTLEVPKSRKKLKRRTSPPTKHLSLVSKINSAAVTGALTSTNEPNTPPSLRSSHKSNRPPLLPLTGHLSGDSSSSTPPTTPPNGTALKLQFEDENATTDEPQRSNRRSTDYSDNQISSNNENKNNTEVTNDTESDKVDATTTSTATTTAITTTTTPDNPSMFVSAPPDSPDSGSSTTYKSLRRTVPTKHSKTKLMTSNIPIPSTPSNSSSSSSFPSPSSTSTGSSSIGSGQTSTSDMISLDSTHTQYDQSKPLKDVKMTSSSSPPRTIKQIYAKQQQDNQSLRSSAFPTHKFADFSRVQARRRSIPSSTSSTSTTLSSADYSYNDDDEYLNELCDDSSDINSESNPRKFRAGTPLPKKKEIVNQGKRKSFSPSNVKRSNHVASGSAPNKSSGSIGDSPAKYYKSSPTIKKIVKSSTLPSSLSSSKISLISDEPTDSKDTDKDSSVQTTTNEYDDHQSEYNTTTTNRTSSTPLSSRRATVDYKSEDLSPKSKALNSKKTKSSAKQQHKSQHHEGIACREYIARTDKELTIIPGEHIADITIEPTYAPEYTNVHEENEANIVNNVVWYSGKVNERAGVFPQHCVEISCTNYECKLHVEEEYVPDRLLPSTFDSRYGEEIEIKVGEELVLLGATSDGWMRGKKENGQIGLIPSKNVRLKR
eukprot:TRINITY_DN7228_c0_g2_i1.p1 TRINITY_DN7228_c0_g2~~TRINITY_DN7228_c0_g2_i1.p1  ORF type:complete len:1325 (+),score=389.70 TRINITY_DN7228_c0_g2_i1:47-4021(+)